MFLFNNKQPSILGVDISATAIKLLEFSQKEGKYTIESYAVEALPSSSVINNIITDIEVVGEVVARAVKKSGSRAKQAAVCVAGSTVITKVISMPSGLSDDEMETQIQFEADQYIPFPLEEVAIDFEVIGDSEEGADRVNVLLAASRLETVDNVVSSIELGGLNAKIVDVEAFVIENTIELISGDFPARISKDAIAVADIGYSATNFSVMENMKMIYSREETFGGLQLTEEIQRKYGLTLQEAELAKINGGLPANYEQEVLEPFKGNLASQIGRALQFFYASSQISSVDILVLAGGCSSISGVAELIESRLGVKTIIANPFANMALAPKVNAESLAKHAPAMMIACGLALRGSH